MKALISLCEKLVDWCQQYSPVRSSVCFLISNTVLWYAYTYKHSWEPTRINAFPTILRTFHSCQHNRNFTDHSTGGLVYLPIWALLELRLTILKYWISKCCKYFLHENDEKQLQTGFISTGHFTIHPVQTLITLLHCRFPSDGLFPLGFLQILYTYRMSPTYATCITCASRFHHCN
jgi:hypothetical protein